MSFKVFLGTLSKRENSTERLGTADMTEYSCIILRGSGVLNPKIELNLGLSTDPSVYNIAAIPAFNNRYYWVREWVFNDGLWIAYLEVDVLATYKAKIGSTNMYILRAANEHNGQIQDNLYPVKTGCTFETVAKNNRWKGIDDGFFVLGIVSRSGMYGSITYYAMTPANMAALVTNLIQTTITTGNGFSWDDASQALQKAIIDPIQYIRSCIFIPRPIGDISGTNVSSIPIFDWNVSASAKIPNVTEDYVSLEYTIPQHPDTSDRGDYVNSSPYTIMTINIPPFGVVEIDTSVTCNASKLYVDIHLDIFTGRGVLEIICNGEVLNSIEAQVGVPVQISQVSKDYMGSAMSALGTVGSALSGNFLGALAGIGSAATALVPRSNTIGSQGSFTALSSSVPFTLFCQFFRPVDDDNFHNGRPLCAIRKPENLGGYMLVQDGDVAITGTMEEGKRIKDYLETGFYYE